MPDGKSTKLAAIMFTDIVGYSNIMEENEERAIGVIKEHNSILFPLVEGFGGTIIDAIGDGLLVVFDSALTACNCALEIQRGIDVYDRGVDADRQFRIRIGIHLGDIWFEEQRVFGNGVNIAARLEPHAKPGGICISEDVYRQISNKITVDVEDLGEKYLKNIKRSLRLFHLKTGVEDALVPVNEDEDDLEATIVRELTAAQEKLHVRRETLRTKEKDGGFEERIEGAVTGFVETVLGKALTEWKNAPEEKKEKARAKLRNADIDIDLGKGGAKIVVGSGGKDKNDDGDKPGDEIMVGIVAGIGFGYGYFIAGVGWLIVPFILIGVLPFVIGLGKWVKRLVGRKERDLAKRRKLERHIVLKMREAGGKASVMTLAADTELTLDEIQDQLVEMTKKGYISQDIDPSGTLIYSIPEMLSDGR